MRFRRECKSSWLAALAFGLDRATKALVQASSGVRPLIPGVLRCRPVRNTGMAFSLLADHPWLLAAATALVLASLTAWLIARPDEPPLTRAGFWLIVGGGLGNLFDRLVYGYVIDFLETEFMRFAIFNVADVCVCVGAGLALLGMTLSEKGKKGRA